MLTIEALKVQARTKAIASSAAPIAPASSQSSLSFRKTSVKVGKGFEMINCEFCVFVEGSVLMLGY
jgi:hypothetical protein